MLSDDIGLDTFNNSKKYSDNVPLLRRSGGSGEEGDHETSQPTYGSTPTKYVAMRKLTLGEKISYGLGEGGLSIYQVIKGFFLNTFLLSVAKMDPLYSALILFTTKAVDAFSDIFVGSLSDRTKSRWGRRRVWILFGALPLACLYCALWFVPPFGQIAKVAYYQIVVILLSIAYTCVAIPYSAMNAEITDDYDERTNLAGLRMISMMLGGVVSSFVHSMLITVFTKEEDGVEVTNYEKGYLLSGGVWGFAMMIPLGITFYGTRNIKNVNNTSESHVPFFKGLAVMFSNRAFITVTLFLYFIPRGNMPLVWGVAAFGGIGVAVAFLVPMSMLPDVVELDELKTGERREGIFYSLFLFFQKLGLSVGLAVSNFVLSAAGYTSPDSIDGSSDEIIDNNKENDTVIFALRMLVSVVPAVIVLFSFVAFKNTIFGKGNYFKHGDCVKSGSSKIDDLFDVLDRIDMLMLIIACGT
ncbi:hypothetical protein PPL_08781 [Heterostelium album PN500]|uniref:Uncharacterized protein n=1 Tax=Heterostelium pallidum (strain ATCC 26659 / Pp 5 / PN500) TaxID=670386 RepID=D3BJQ2_HETP5|nr:hypothetical protein PPL_08781 [Heterostelium album PN500]EFA78132.1 hypothetical protein PPL_08781 [Heterostelium album PN500]|eukprot:XP_020430258.1 hypothetical protein PPL_08781 [Heterostelium album PN500]